VRVVDASASVHLLVPQNTPSVDITDDVMVAPGLLDIEVASALRRLGMTGQMEEAEARS
jgi:predicted nucleic acid-binding protein